jgi:hypothetical protein
MTDLLTLILGALAGLIALVVTYWRGRSDGRTKSQSEALKDAVDRTEQGRAAVRDGRASGDSPVDRLRKNDGKW